MRKHAFSLLLIAVIGLAIAFPVAVAEGSVLRSSLPTKLGVAIIFLLQGLSLPLQSLAAGYQPLRLHRFVLIWNFLCFPAVAVLILVPISHLLSDELLVGFGLLALLPTTIASATAYTALSGGNVANAIVATVLSNLMALFVVPIVFVAYFKWEFAVELPLGASLGSFPWAKCC